MAKLLMRCLCFAGVLFSATSARLLTHGQELGARGKASDSQQKAIVQLMSSAESLPIEFRSDIELDSIESGKLPLSSKIGQRLEQLFVAADEANFKYPLRAINPGADALERELTSALAFYNLDSFSIKLRVVQAMLKYDGAEARKELGEITPIVAGVGCKSPFVPSLSKAYSQFDVLARQAFVSDSKDQEQYLRWISEQVQGITSVAQLASVASLLTKAPIGANDFQNLLIQYSAVLRRLHATDREMAAIWSDPGGDDLSLDTALHDLAERSSQDSIRPVVLVEAYRAFLSGNAEETPCGDITADWKMIIREFNQLAEGVYAGKDAPTLDPNEWKRKRGAPKMPNSIFYPKRVILADST